MEKSVLIHAGLTPNESEIYLLLLKKTSALASEIASETKISRPHVYDSIKRLAEKGLASYVIKDNKRYFKAANPKELISFLDEEKADIDSRQKEITNLLPSLLRIHSEKKPKTSVELYEGKEGLKTVLMDIVNDGEDFVAFGATHKFEKVLPVFSKAFISRRKQKKIKAKILVVEGENPVKTELNEYRWVPKEYSMPSSTVVYADKAAILLWSLEPIGIIIRSKEVSESYKHYFELLWKIGNNRL